MSLPPDSWLFALNPPRAHGEPLGAGAIKFAAEDFVVEERLGFSADGGDAHELLKVQKRGLDTLALTRQLARIAGVSSRDVGFAGLKDRHAITTQWLTVPASRPPIEWQGVAGDGFLVTQALPHSRKLKRGALKGNLFSIVLRDVTVDAEALSHRIEVLKTHGVPNYFGAQRFGRDGGNLDLVDRFASNNELPYGREPRAFVYSAARSLIFNALLARRVLQGTWNRLLPGELVNLDGRNSWFVLEEFDEVLAQRLDRLDIHPTGPMAGKGAALSGEVGALEASVLAEFASLVERLSEAGLEADRRPLRLAPTDLVAQLEGTQLHVQFGLPAGAYATVVVREILSTELPAQDAAND